MSCNWLKYCLYVRPVRSGKISLGQKCNETLHITFAFCSVFLRNMNFCHAYHTFSGNLPCLGGTARHQRWTISSTIFTTTHTTTNKQNSFLLQSFAATLTGTKYITWCSWFVRSISDEFLIEFFNQLFWWIHACLVFHTWESVYSELPPSMIMSPFSNNGTCQHQDIRNSLIQKQ